MLKRLSLPATETQRATPDNGGPRLGWTSTAITDLNHDGQPDFIAGAPFADAKYKDQGVLYVFLSTDRTRPHLPDVRGPRFTRNSRPHYRVRTRDGDNPFGELTIRCALDRGRLKKCGERFSRRLSRGLHVLRVQAIDPAGNRSQVRKVRITRR